jgi:hypothetical protein
MLDGDRVAFGIVVADLDQVPLGATPCALAWPSSGLFARFSFFSTQPSWTAV